MNRPAPETSANDESLPLRQATAASIFVGILRSVRPHQWVKNLFVLAPLFFSKTFLIPEKLGLGLAAALLFSLTAGAVYLLNDVFDVEKDRRHPVKKHRPIASGALPVSIGAIASAVLGLGSVAAGFLIDPWLGLVLGIYLTMNLGYSTLLKHVPFVDVSIIAIGFVLRIVSGALAIDVYVSEWLFACTFLLALYLGLGKRQHELKLVQRGEATKVRKVLERYRAEHLDFAVLFTGGLTIAAYTIYTLSASLPNQPLRAHQTPFDSPYLRLTVPFTVFGIVRFYQIINHDSPHSPTDLILKDWAFLINMALWGGSMLVIAFV